MYPNLINNKLKVSTQIILTGGVKNYPLKGELKMFTHSKNYPSESQAKTIITSQLLAQGCTRADINRIDLSEAIKKLTKGDTSPLN